MNRNAHGRARRFAVWCMLLMLVLTGSALAEVKIEIVEDDWTWEEGGLGAFHGTVLSDQEVSGAQLTLSVETRLEDSGEVVFTVVDGKKLKIRKRAPETETDLAAGTEMTFEGEWYLPDELDGGISHAVIHLTAADADGNALGEGILEVGDLAADGAAGGSALTGLVNQAILYLAIASAVIWVLAVSRHLILNRKRKEAV